MSNFPEVCSRCGSPLKPGLPCRACEPKSNKTGRRSASPRPRSPREVVADWRAAMDERHECLLWLLWDRTFRVFGVDIKADAPEQVPATTLYDAVKVTVEECGGVAGWPPKGALARYDKRFAELTGCKPRHREPPDNKK